MARLSVLDLGFLVAEDFGAAAHIGGLEIFEIPRGYRGNFARQLYEELLASNVGGLFRRKLKTPLIGMPRWVEDERFDLDYHLRLSALPKPGNEEDLLRLIERLHSRRLDRSRPLWECYLIEGLKGRRFALYFKMHHACIDGMGGIRLMEASLNPSPDELIIQPIWGLGSDERSMPRTRPSLGQQWEKLFTLVRGQLKAGPELAGELGKQALQTLGLRTGKAPVPFVAPETPFNVKVGDARRFAVAQLPLERAKAIGKVVNGTINDVVMAVSAGAVQRYLAERGLLPEKPLLALIPMSVRREDGESGGNQVIATHVNLATDIVDPRARLEEIVASATEAKTALRKMSATASQDLALVVGAIMALTQKPSANLPISNMPGPKNTLYLKGARLVEIYPVSMLGNGWALNITLNSYGDTLFFGLVADREAVPELGQVARYLEEAFATLERAVLPESG